MAPVVLMMLLPEKDLGPLAVQTVRAGLVTLVLPGITPRLVVRTATEDLDITTGEKVRVGSRAPAAPVVLDPMLGHMVRAGHKAAGKSPKADLDQTANKRSTTRRSAQSSRDRLDVLAYVATISQDENTMVSV
jgi:hypothetical protein